MNRDVEIVRPLFVRPFVVEPGVVVKARGVCVVIVGCKRRGGVVIVAVASVFVVLIVMLANVVVMVIVTVASDTSCRRAGIRYIVWLTAGVRLGGSGMGAGNMVTPTGGSDCRDNVVVVRGALDSNDLGLVEVPPQRLYHGYLVVDVCCGPAIKDIYKSKTR